MKDMIVKWPISIIIHDTFAHYVHLHGADCSNTISATVCLWMNWMRCMSTSIEALYVPFVHSYMHAQCIYIYIYICLLNDSRVVSHSLCSSVILFAVALLRPRFVRLSLTATTTPVPFAYKTQTQISKAHSNTHNTARQYLSCVKVIINTYAITAFICNS